VLIGWPLVFLGLWIKSRTEEQFMSAQFGDEYAAYRAQVKSLIPFVW
jgi:protein-S-isoprenylcysteine O-methyltransferase Ste14